MARMDWTMKHRKRALAALAAASLLLSGCATAAGAAGPGNTAVAPSSSSAAAKPGHAGGHGHGSSTSPGAPQAVGPSDAARMVCGDQPMDRLTSILDLESKPHTVEDWADSTFTCTYHLEEGALEISVREAGDEASARTYFDAMQALAKDAKPVEGLANLGFPAYETADGSAVFLKDNFVLHVDASDLPAVLGPESITRNALAYQLSTTILACWIEHP